MPYWCSVPHCGNYELLQASCCPNPVMDLSAQVDSTNINYNYWKTKEVRKPPDRGRREQRRHRDLVGDDNVSRCGAPSLAGRGAEYSRDSGPGDQSYGLPRVDRPQPTLFSKTGFTRYNQETESDEDVIFVSEKCAHTSKEITVDQVKRLALQRDIDQQSLPRQLNKPLGSVAVERPVEMVTMKMEGEKSEENFVKNKKKRTKEQAPLLENNTFDDGSLAEVKKEKKKAKKADVIVRDVDEESCDEKEEKKKKKKRKILTESLNDDNGPDVKNGNDKEGSKKKKKKLETAEFSSVKEEEEVQKKQRKEKKVKDKSVQIIPENAKKEEEEEQQAGKDKLPKKVKKRKIISVVNTEESEKQVKEKKKKKNTDEDATEAVDGKSVTKKKNTAKMKVGENGVKLETAEVEVEEVKVKKKKKKATKEDGNELGTPQIKGNNKKSINVEKDDMNDNKKKDKSTKSEIVLVDEGETERKKKGKKEKGRKASVEVGKVEETEKPKKKKRKKGNSKGEEEEEPLVLKCEDVEEQSSETVVTVTGGTTDKKSKRKRSSTKEETQVEAVSFGTGAKKKKKKIKEEVEDQHESPNVDVVFLSEKPGNADEVNINQERRQALQMDVDKASQPLKPDKPTGLGQWTTAQFDSSEKQQKFLRLMGGFKKGSQLAAGSSGGANMALGKDAQQQLQQGLLGEFERAQSRRMDFSNRGSGLGFTAPSNKKFAIDINSCRSVRFDD